MSSLSTRLTTLYATVFAGMLITMLLCSYFLLHNHLLNHLDIELRANYKIVRDQLVSDSNPDVPGVMAMSQISSAYTLNVEDMWNDPTYREARLKGEFLPKAEILRFFSQKPPDGANLRTIEGIYQSLKIQLSTSLESVDYATATYAKIAGSISVLLLLGSISFGHRLSRYALRPVQAIERTADQISSNNLSERIPVPTSKDEIANLAKLLNQMFDRLEASFEEIKRFSGDVSHELKTPLSLVRLNIERVILNDALLASDREALQDAVEEIHNLNRLIESLLFIARAEAGEVKLNREPAEASTLIKTFFNDAQLLAELGGCFLTITRNELGSVTIDAGRIRQVLLNLVSNAINASPSGGRVEIEAFFEAQKWCISIHDEGSGVRPEYLRKIFGRFSRTPMTDPSIKPQTGAGLGLAISKSIIDLHHGEITAKNRTDRSGLSVQFHIPFAP